MKLMWQTTALAVATHVHSFDDIFLDTVVNAAWNFFSVFLNDLHVLDVHFTPPPDNPQKRSETVSSHVKSHQFIPGYNDSYVSLVPEEVVAFSISVKPRYLRDEFT